MQDLDAAGKRYLQALWAQHTSPDTERVLAVLKTRETLRSIGGDKAVEDVDNVAKMITGRENELPETLRAEAKLLADSLGGGLPNYMQGGAQELGGNTGLETVRMGGR